MVRWLGRGELDQTADLLMDAIENVSDSGVRTRDMGGQATTKEVTDAVSKEVEKLISSKK